MGTSRYDKQRYAIIAEYADLDEDGTRSGEICPACEGGSTKEGSLSVSRRGGVLLWHCHRASCGFSGSDRVASEGGPKTRELGRSPPDVKVSPLDTATSKFLALKFGLPITSIGYAGIGWVDESSPSYRRRFAFPIFDPLAGVRGTSYRSYEGDKPKNLIRLDYSGAVAASWYRWRRHSDSVVLVEDQVSAIKLAPHVDAVALLGTNLSDAKVEEILSVSPAYKNIHLSLDLDAVADAIKTQLRLREKVPHLRITAIECDVKNMNKKQFDTYLERVLK